MDIFQQTFTPAPQCKIQICDICRIGIIRHSLKYHLDKKHRFLPASVRKEIVEAAESVEHWAETEDDVIFPTEVIDPIAYLPIYEDGVKCRGTTMEGHPCGRIYKEVKTMQRHCVEMHGWVNTRRPGRGPAQPSDQQMWTGGIRYQKFGDRGILGRCFEVRGEEEECRDEISVAIDRVFDEADEAVEEVRQQRVQQRMERDDAWQANTWVRRTGWASHLAGIDKAALLRSSREPEPGKEKGLARLCLAARVVIWEAQRACVPEVVGMPALSVIHRKETGATSDWRPFNARQSGKTMEKYSERWVRVLCYVWRTHEWRVAARGRREDDEEVMRVRPRYRLTANQERRLRQIKSIIGPVEEPDDADKSDDTDESDGTGESDGIELNSNSGEDEADRVLERHVLAFMVALMEHELGDDECQSPLVSGLSVLGIDSDEGDRPTGWKQAIYYTQILSAVITVAKMIVIYHAHRQREDEIQQFVVGGMDYDEAEDRAAAVLKRVQKTTDRFMSLVTQNGGNASPASYILGVRAYGIRIRMNTPSEGVIGWNDDTLLAGHVQFSMAQLRGMIHGTVSEARAKLWRELMLLQVDEDGSLKKGTATPPEIPWNQLADDAFNAKPGYSYVTDIRNRYGGMSFKDAGKAWMKARMNEDGNRREFIVEASIAGARRNASGDHSGSDVSWSIDRVMRYGRAMAAFRKQLFQLVHMTGGSPGRATEVLTVQHVNTEDGEYRGFLIEDGMVAVVTMYHKGIAITNQVKVIHRYLPREVGELVVWYQWIVLPFWARVQWAITGETSVGAGTYLWEPLRETPWARPQAKRVEPMQPARPGIRSRVRVRRTVEGEEGSGQGGGSGGQDEREDERRGSREERGEDGSEDGSRDSGISAIFESELWDTNRARMALQDAALSWMGTRLTIAVWRKAVKGIFVKYIDDKEAIATVADMEEDDAEEDDPVDLMSGHSSEVANLFYAKLMTESPFEVQRVKAKYRKVSLEWHRFLMFQSTLDAEAAGKAPVPRFRRESKRAESRRWKQLRRVDIQEQLETIVGEGAQFRGMQKPALEAIMQQKSPVLAVMGTGTGKSVLFMLPASCSSGVTVVVTPLLSLMGDMKKRCEAASISCAEWPRSKAVEWAQVVLVTPEAVVGEAFASFMNRQRAVGRLDRIVVDECHVPLDSTGGWRTRMLQLKSLVQFGTQLVYCTATLAPRDEPEWRRIMGVPELHVFRGSTTRPNVAYQVQQSTAKEVENTVVELVARKKEQYPMPGQMIVYCSQVEVARRLAERMQCVCYHRNAGSRQEKEEMVRQLTEGRQQVFTATNALGLGIDAPTIRAVIHVGTIRKMRNYAQESGRAGRDGKASEAIIVQTVHVDQAGRVRGVGMDASVEEEVKEFITGTGCMRVAIDRMMDGREDRVGCEEGEEKCGRCTEYNQRVPSRNGSRSGSDSDEASRDAVDKQPTRSNANKHDTPTVIQPTASAGEGSDGGAGEGYGVLGGLGLVDDVDARQDSQAGEDGAIDIQGHGGNSTVNPDDNKEDEEDSNEEGSEDEESSEEESDDEGEASKQKAAFEMAIEQSRRQRSAQQSSQAEGSQAASMQSLIETIETWSQRCKLCMARGQEGSAYEHATEDCAVETEQTEQWQRAMEWVEPQIRWEGYSGCYSCGLPQAECPSFRALPNGRGWHKTGDVPCPFPGVLVQSTMALMTVSIEETIEWIKQQSGMQGKEGAAFNRAVVAWFCRKHRWGGRESNNMCWAFMQLAKQGQGRG